MQVMHTQKMKKKIPQTLPAGGPGCTTGSAAAKMMVPSPNGDEKSCPLFQDILLKKHRQSFADA